MAYSNNCHRFSCSVMLELGSRATIVIKWPAVVLVIWPHFNGNAQRRSRSASSGLALFSSRVCCFLCTTHGYTYPRGKTNPPRGCPKLPGRIPVVKLQPAAATLHVQDPLDPIQHHQGLMAKASHVIFNRQDSTKCRT